MLSGAGKTFCAGADVTWMSRTVEFTEEENLRDAMAMSQMFGALDVLPVPLVCRVQGAALGGGAGLAAVCDIVVAAEDAVFGFTEVKLGILPAVISPYVLRAIGPRSRSRRLAAQPRANCFSPAHVSPRRERARSGSFMRSCRRRSWIRRSNATSVNC